MKRPRIPTATETEVLLRSRRRCSICFGLQRDTALKPGQIAHLDRDRCNIALDNLAFLCLEHHDQYDSRTSQSKNFTVAEVRALRAELYKQVAGEWNTPVTTRLVNFETAGRFSWARELATAELQVSLIGGAWFHVEGFATWGRLEAGVHTGDVSFDCEVRGNETVYREPGSQYSLRLCFVPGGVIATEEPTLGAFGLNVTFAGRYTRIA